MKIIASKQEGNGLPLAGDPDIAALNRTMKDAVHSMKQMTRVLEAANANIVGIYKHFTDDVQEPNSPMPNGHDLFHEYFKEECAHPPRVLGWKIADGLESVNGLNQGDTKVHSDGETLSVWKNGQWTPASSM